MESWDYLKNNGEILLTLAALIISIGSFLLTYWTINVQRKLNRLSVKPIPEILLDKKQGLKVELKNLGVGPLTCKALLTKDNLGQPLDHMKDILPKGLHLTGEIFTNRWDFSILPGDSIILLLISETWTKNSPSDALKEASKALSTLTLFVSYTSIYDEKFPLYQKS